MPQLNATMFPPQLIWLALTFFVLFFLMAKLALPPIASTIANRRNKVEGDLDRAARLRAEIDVVVQAYERALAEARSQAANTVNATRERLAQIAAERQRESIAVITDRTKAAEAQIEQAKQTALSNVRGIATDAARQATIRLIGSAPDDARIGMAVDAAIQESA